MPRARPRLNCNTQLGYSRFYGVWKIDLDNADQDFDDTTGIDDFWDFGTSNQYPVLKADLDGDGNATWREFGAQVRDRPTPTPTPTLEPTLAPTSTPTLYSNLDSYTNANSDPETYSHTCAHPNSCTYVYSYTHTYTHARPDAYGNDGSHADS